MAQAVSCQACYFQRMIRLQCKDWTQAEQGSPGLTQEMELEIKDKCSRYGRALESYESYGGFPSILPGSLARAKIKI